MKKKENLAVKERERIFGTKKMQGVAVPLHKIYAMGAPRTTNNDQQLQNEFKLNKKKEQFLPMGKISLFRSYKTFF